MFEDDNLAMAVLNSLVWPDHHIPEIDWAAVRAANPYDPDDHWDDIFDDDGDEDADDGFDDEDDKQAYFQEACGVRYLHHGVVIDAVSMLAGYADKLPDLRSVWWQVPCDPMRTAWPGWDGESDEFDIASFEGIARCSGLTSVDIQLLHHGTDLRPLTGLPLLEDFHTSADLRDWTPLLAIPTLRTVRGMVDEDVARELTARGVTVTRGR